MEGSEEEQRGVVRFLVAEGAGTRYKVKMPWNAVGRNHLLHYNSHPQTVNLVRYKLHRFGWKHFNILRTSQIFPLVTHIFGDLKSYIRGRRFHSDEEVQEWVRL